MLYEEETGSWPPRAVACALPYPTPPQALSIEVKNLVAVLTTGGEGQTPVAEEKPAALKAGRIMATAPERRMHRVPEVRGSLLRGMEASICRPVRSWEVQMLPGSCIQDVTERLNRLIHPSDHYPVLLIHMGTNDTAGSHPEQVSSDYRALAVRRKELGRGAGTFSLILLVKGRGPGSDRHILEVNAGLRGWCCQEGFNFLDHGMLFQGAGLLSRDGVHLSGKGKSIFGYTLADLVRPALN